MENITLGRFYLKELEVEAPASRKCLGRVPETLFSWKPHEKSMPMGYLALIIAEIPLWLTYIVERSEIDFATIKHFQPKTTAELVGHFEENIEGARRALQGVSDQMLTEPFFLKNNGQTLFSSPKSENVGSSINHLVHHRGQLTVYLRLNNIPVPSIYGPSADERNF